MITLLFKKIVMKIKSNNNLWELIKYGFWGLLTTYINLRLFFLMIEFKNDYIFSNVVSYFIAVIISYYVNNKFVFNSTKTEINSSQVIKFISIRIISVVIDSLLLKLCVEYFKFDIRLAKIGLSFTIILITYFFNKKVVFIKNKEV